MNEKLGDEKVLKGKKRLREVLERDASDERES